MYGVYDKNDDEILIFKNEKQVLEKYLKVKIQDILTTYSIYTDGFEIAVYETSAGANGCLYKAPLKEFLESFTVEDDGFIIRNINY